MAATRKDYEAIAQSLRDMGWNFQHDRIRWTAWASAVMVVAEGIASNNANFNRYKFIKACGIWDENDELLRPYEKERTPARGYNAKRHG